MKTKHTQGKKCSICKEEKHDTDFCWKQKNIIRESKCRACKSAQSKLRYKTYKPTQRVLESMRKKEMRQFLIDYKSKNPCVDCGEANPLVLEFDHISKNNKSYTIATMHGNSKSKVLKEIEKCEMRCANCHAIKTAKNYYKDLIIPIVKKNKLIASAPEMLEMILRLKGLLEESVDEFNMPELNELIKQATE